MMGRRQIGNFKLHNHNLSVYSVHIHFPVFTRREMLKVNSHTAHKLYCCLFYSRLICKIFYMVQAKHLLIASLLTCIQATIIAAWIDLLDAV